MELYDGIPVTSYQGRFSGSFEVDGNNNDLLKLGKVCLWVVVARSGESQTKEIADGEEAQRKVVQKVEAAIPLQGDLRDEAIVWMSHDGERGSVGFARENTPAERQLEKLGLYLEEFHGESLKPEGSESVIDATMRLLDRLAMGVPIEREAQLDDQIEALEAVLATPADEESYPSDEDWDKPLVSEPSEATATATIHDRRFGVADDEEVDMDDLELVSAGVQVATIHDRRF